MTKRADIKVPTQITVSKVFKLRSGEEEEEASADESIAIHTFATEPAVVGVGFGLTINLGNFESARLDVSIRVPCYREQVAEAYDAAHEFVAERVKKEVAEIQSRKSKQL